jgi:hypothetical protein
MGLSFGLIFRVVLFLLLVGGLSRDNINYLLYLSASFEVGLGCTRMILLEFGSVFVFAMFQYC